MQCPNCEGYSRVTDSRECRKSIRRRRLCLSCGHRYTTFEVPYKEGIKPWRQCNKQGCGKKVEKSAVGWSLCPEHYKEKYNKWKKSQRVKERNRRKLNPSPRDLLRDKYPRRIANAISQGKMTVEEAAPYKKEIK